jgi:hypothetical protein
MAAPATQCLVRSWRLRFDETGSDRVAGELGTVSQSQRLKDVGAVALDGLETDGQQGCDFLRRVSFGDEFDAAPAVVTSRNPVQPFLKTMAGMRSPPSDRLWG